MNQRAGRRTFGGVPHRPSAVGGVLQQFATCCVWFAPPEHRFAPRR